ncbi:hypothetical protein CRUP_026658 [Coryphaenoides rupestris]|nr:hypothetical protein CRUP_026658 [Coryphaenoides rupestris]
MVGVDARGIETREGSDAIRYRSVVLRGEGHFDPDLQMAWEFSSGFSPVDRWRFHGGPHMSRHLTSCPFYQTAERPSEPVALPCLRDVAAAAAAAVAAAAQAEIRREII